jgi:hypothetical protein
MAAIVLKGKGTREKRKGDGNPSLQFPAKHWELETGNW